jgi:hypothetical protein
MKVFGRGGPEHGGGWQFGASISRRQSLGRMLGMNGRRSLVSDAERLQPVPTDDLEAAMRVTRGLNREAFNIILRAAAIPPQAARSDLRWGVPRLYDGELATRDWVLELRTGNGSETARQVGELGELRYISKYHGPQRILARAMILRCQVDYDASGEPQSAATILQCSSYGQSLRPLNSDPRIVHGSAVLGLQEDGGGIQSFAVMRHDQKKFYADEVYDVELENFMLDAYLAVNVAAEMHAGIAKIPVETGI